MISVPYGSEDPANRPRGPWPIVAHEKAVSCWCGNLNQLALIGERFFCISHRPKT